MPDNFTAENVNSAGQIFATDQDSGSSVHYPIGKIAWGALNTFNITDTATPLPVRLWGNNSAAPVHITSDSAAPPILRVTSDSATPFYLDTDSDDFLFVGNDSGHPVFVRDENSTTVTVTNDSLDPMGVTNNSGNALFIRGTSSNNGAAGDRPVLVGGRFDSTAISYDNADLAAFALDSNGHLFVNPGPDNDVTVSGNVSVVNSSSAALFVTGSSSTQIGTVTNPAADSLGLTPFTGSISSLATTVKNTVGRLYGWYISNPSSNTAGAYLKVYAEDSAGVTLGTNSAVLDFWIPPEGAANMSTPVGISMSSGISVAAAGGAGSTNHASPPASLTVSVWYA